MELISMTRRGKSDYIHSIERPTTSSDSLESSILVVANLLKKAKQSCYLAFVPLGFDCKYSTHYININQN